MRGVILIFLLLLVGPHRVSLAEEGDSSRASSPLTSDEHVEDPLAITASEIARSDTNQATDSGDVGTVEVQGQESEEKSLNEESGGEDRGAGIASIRSIRSNNGEPVTTSTAAPVSQESSTHDVAAVAAEPEDELKEEGKDVVLSGGEKWEQKLEQEAEDGGLLFKSAAEDVPLPAAEDALEGVDGQHDADRYSSAAEERTDGAIGSLGKQRGGFIDGWRRRFNREEGGQSFKEALRSYDSLLKEHYVKMSFAQASWSHPQYPLIQQCDQTVQNVMRTAEYFRQIYYIKLCLEFSSALLKR